MTVRVVMPSDRDAWLQARQRFITASVAGALLNCHPYTTAYQLWADKTGRASQDADENSAMRRGRLLEPAAIAMLGEERPDWVIDYRADSAFYCDDDIRIGATPDAFAMRPDRLGRGVVQIKTSSEEAYRTGWLDPQTGDVEVPLWIAIQAIVEASMTKAAWASVAVMVVGRAIHMEVIDIPLDGPTPVIWKNLIASTAEFWRIVETGEHPPVDWERDVSAVIDVNRFALAKTVDLTSDVDFDAYVARLEDVRTQRRDLQKREEALRAQILYTMHDADIAETQRFTVLAPSTINKDGRNQRAIRIKLKDQSNGRY